jgi:hypothetical protein
MILDLIQPFLFHLRSVSNHIKSYVETIRNGISLLVFDQGGIIVLKYIRVSYLSQYESIWDMNRE